MDKKYLSIREIVEPIIGGFWGENVEPGLGNSRVVRNSDVLSSGEIGQKAPERLLSEKEIEKAKLKKGDILITMSGNVGRVARVAKETDKNGNPFVASNFIKILRVKDDILPAYLFFFLKSHQFQIEISKYTRGVAIQNLSTKVFDQEFLPNIPVKEQMQIVELLEKTELLKKKKFESNNKMPELISAIFNKMFGDPSSNSKKWETEKISKYFTFLGGGTPSKNNISFWNGNIPWVSPKDMKSDYIDDSQDHITDEAIKKSATNLIPKNSILVVTRSGILQHTVPLAMTKKDLTINQDLKSLVNMNHNKVNSIFIYIQLKTREKEILKMVKTGATVQSLNTDYLKNLKIIIPPIELQNKFAEIIKDIELQKEKQKESSTKIDNLFSSILSTL
jgi:type I restriction enzyme S subunit